MINAYDEIAYPSAAFPRTHPDRLAAHATLFGLRPAPLERCRVLEIGAGDGSNLIPMALGLPGASFVGFDLARAPVSRGCEVVRALGLANISLLQGDIMDVDLGGEPFDYVVAQGVYSWVPDAVRDGLMRLVSRVLAPHGVAYISYNTLPGCYIRLAIREQLLFETRGVAGRTARVEGAMRRLEAWPAPTPGTAAFHRAVAEEAALMRKRSTATLAHDELSDAYHPAYVSAFSAHCARNALQIIGDADPGDVAPWLAPSDPPGAAAFDFVAVAQRADFAENRFFRQSLVVGATAPVSRRVRAEDLASLHMSSSAKRSGGPRFECRGGPSFDLNDPPLATALEHLGSIWPATAPVASLVHDPERRLALLRLLLLGVLELHAAPSAFVTTSGDRPTASPLARLQARQGDKRLTTLRHAMVDIDDAFGRAFVAGLDGTRTRADLARDVAPHFKLTPESAAGPLGVLLDVLGHAPLLVA